MILKSTLIGWNKKLQVRPKLGFNQRFFLKEFMIRITWWNKNKNKIIFIIVNHDAWQSLLIGYINDCINLNIIENKKYRLWW
jgi:hypothetical protein